MSIYEEYGAFKDIDKLSGKGNSQYCFASCFEKRSALKGNI